MPKFYIFVTDCFCNVMPYTSYSEKLPGPGCRILFRTLVLTFCLCLLSGFEVRAQSAQRKFVVRGHVTDQTGAPLVGVTVVEHGTSNGVATLSGGEFSISVAPGAVLDVSCVGYVSRSVPTENRTGLDITLEEDVKVIADVIVTALGLERNYADLTYSADKIKGTQLTNVKSSNMILSLAGKSAGVQVNESSSGAGASSKISIRGVRSVASDNQPLYVVDGMPILNSSPEQAYTAIGGVADAGNRGGGRHLEPQCRGHRERLDPQGRPGGRAVRQSGRQRRDPDLDQEGQRRETAARDLHFEPYVPEPFPPAGLPEPLRGERRRRKLGSARRDEGIRQRRGFFPDGRYGDELAVGLFGHRADADLLLLRQYRRARNHGLEPPDAA